MASSVIDVRPLGFPWQPPNPFLFCVHHDDAYPKGNAAMGPAASLAGRNLGSDFEGKDGFRMYHGQTVPGFPQHPHRGFETVTIVRRGLIDHSDSLGATARFGAGDVQWLTAGAGIVHAEMFPLVSESEPNPLELFQIWLNLPAEDKMVAPHFSMLWSHQIPVREIRDAAGRRTEVTVIAGSYAETNAPAPPPKSWAARKDTDVAILLLRLDPGARFTLPRAIRDDAQRSLFLYRGDHMRVDDRDVDAKHAVDLDGELATEIIAGDTEIELLLLQGRAIEEPIAQYGPFVMNTREEIQRAMQDYQRTRFGGWPWSKDDPVHARDTKRFAKHADGRVERVENAEKAP